jgi:4-amino-4-deoxy-L-arabinose transferase-like glycosyltransferase
MISFIKKHYPILIYLIFFTCVFSVKIINNPAPFYDWDESIYAQVGREMIDNKSFLVPLWQGEYWLDKPPLAPLFYGIIMWATPFILPEISTRLATLYLSVLALILMYKLYFKVFKETYITTLVIVITSVTQIFLQRAQVLNVDIFVLVGWIGYLLFYKKFTTSLIFLSLAVYSKSLIGFYPVGIILFFKIYQYFAHEINFKELKNTFIKMFIQALILFSWHIFMTINFGGQFLYQHFYESHFKRVTASIESHFGQRTFYIDLLPMQFGASIWYSILGFIILGWQFFRKKISSNETLNSLFFFPWFLFLNLTKTKIFWYAHPYIGQFAFLIVYPITLLKRLGLFYYTIIFTSLILIINYSFIKNTVLDDFYSSKGAHHEVAVFAKNKCSKLNVLIPPDGRTAYTTLKEMNLLISTSHLWGNHPSMVYYYEKPVRFLYYLNEANSILSSEKGCIVLSKEDEQLGIGKKEIYSKDHLKLYKLN